MARGRRPKPVELRKLEGNRGKRKLKAVPQYTPITSEPPAFLDDLAKDEWIRIYSELSESGVLKTTDLMVFAAYCQAASRWQLAEIMVLEEGFIVSTPNGTPMQNPWIHVLNKSFKQLMDSASRLGLDPSSRTAIGTPEGKSKASPWGQLDAV